MHRPDKRQNVNNKDRILKQTKQFFGCEECSSQTDLEWHHVVDETRDFWVNRASFTRSWRAIMNELDKCIVLCAPCHRSITRIREYARLGIVRRNRIPRLRTGQRKLARSQVDFILADSEHSQSELANMFSVTQGAISLVRNGKNQKFSRTYTKELKYGK